MANQLSIKHNGLIQFYVIEIFLEIFRSFISITLSVRSCWIPLVPSLSLDLHHIFVVAGSESSPLISVDRRVYTALVRLLEKLANTPIGQFSNSSLACLSISLLTL